MPPPQVSVDIEIDCPEPIAVHECRGLQETRRTYAVLRSGRCVWDFDLRKQLRSAPDQQQRSLVPQLSVTFLKSPRDKTRDMSCARCAAAICVIVWLDISLIAYVSVPNTFRSRFGFVRFSERLYAYMEVGRQ